MALRVCPRCEVNYLREGETYCDICRRNMKCDPDESEQNMCIECGDNRALKGKDYCAYCLADMRRLEKLEKIKDQPTELTVELTQLDEIDVPNNAGIPSDDLKDIHEEFGDAKEEEPIEEGGLDDDDDDDEDEYEYDFEEFVYDDDAPDDMDYDDDDDDGDM
ncbi:MAG: hypothetical protein LBS18_04695 [Clostridiales bacterium]|jgi:hypothetical protein|nr:hypothetical protein [Clostridiales bacterium]